jgi:proline iminopeptidase
MNHAVLPILALILGLINSTQGQVTAREEGFLTTSDAVRLYYRVEGTGRDTIVVLHGGPGGSLDEIVAGFDALADHHVLIFYDQRGGGRSSRPANTTHLTAAYQIRDLDVVRRHFGLKRMQLLGHSYGALLAATYTIAQPSTVGSLVIVAGLGPRKGAVWERMDSLTTARLGPARRSLVEEAKREINDPHADAAEACRKFVALVLPARLADPQRTMPLLAPHFCTGEPAMVRYAFSVAGPSILASYGDWDFRDQLRRVSVPTLVVHGTEDVIPMDIAQEWVAALPNAQLVQIPAAGHFPFLEQPERFWPAIEEFITATHSRPR